MGDFADSNPGSQGNCSARGSALFKAKQKTCLQAGVLEKTCLVGWKMASSPCRVLEQSQATEEGGRGNPMVAALSQYMAKSPLGAALSCRSSCKSD